jgi:hypothetical protein
MKAHQATHPTTHARPPLFPPRAARQRVSLPPPPVPAGQGPLPPRSRACVRPPPPFLLRVAAPRTAPLPFLLHGAVHRATLKCTGHCHRPLFPHATFSRQEHVEAAYFPPMTSRLTLTAKVIVSSSHFEPSPPQLPPLSELPPWLPLLFDSVVCDMLLHSL